MCLLRKRSQTHALLGQGILILNIDLELFGRIPSFDAQTDDSVKLLVNKYNRQKEPENAEIVFRLLLYLILNNILNDLS